MAHLLNCTGLAKSFGPRPLFEGLSISIHEGERIGLIGPNGAGKSTFLKILAGIETYDGGNLNKRRDLRISYLPQAEDFDLDLPIETLLYNFTPKGLDDFERHAIALEIKNRVGLPDGTGRELSGGYRKRLGIATRLVQGPELFLLDEPTNHLDLEGILWLENLLLESPFAYVVISHDRSFLENVTNRTVEISSRYPQGFISIDGNYQVFLEKREQVVEQLERERQSLSNSVRREVEWLRRQPKARTTKSSSRIEQAEGMINELKAQTSRARSIGQADVEFSSTGRETKQLAVAEKISKRFGEKLIVSGLDISLRKGSKLGVVGRNGSGKSTILKMLTGELEPDSGTVWRAPNLRVVTFDQQRLGLKKGVSLKRYLAPDSDSVMFQDRMIHVASYAARYLFKGEQLETQVSELSGGEQARLLIAKLILEPADLLLLDEPTNDLDIETLESLEESLQDFPGALVIISHDRKLMQEVADTFLVIEDGKYNYVSSYEQWQSSLKQLGNKKSQKKNTNSTEPTRYKDLQKLQKSIEKIEGEIEKLEETLAKDVEAGKDIVELCKKISAKRDDLNSHYEKWQEIENES